MEVEVKYRYLEDERKTNRSKQSPEPARKSIDWQGK